MIMITIAFVEITIERAIRSNKIYSKIKQRRLSTITLQKAVEKSPILLNCKIRQKKMKTFIPPPHNIILVELDLNVKFPLLRLLQFLSDLKSTIPFRKK